MRSQFNFQDVEILRVGRFTSDPPVPARQWPCPACALRKPLDRGYALKIRNRVGLPMERAVLVCGDCAAANLVDYRGETVEIDLDPDDDVGAVVRKTSDSGEFAPVDGFEVS